MTIYQALLGEQFSKLHPRLQERYSVPMDRPFHAEGVMQIVANGTKLLQPFYRLAAKSRFLFPESGQAIPFHITNTAHMNKAGEAEVYWERVFHFPEATRYFNAKMTVDGTGNVVRDYLGDPSFFYSDLLFDITASGHLLIRSGAQKAVLGLLEIPMPSFMEGRVIVEEGYDDVKEVFTIHVSIHHAVFGRVMMYAGEFKEIVS